MSDATWAIQISPRIGDALVNLRADTTDEMGKLVQWATEHAGDIATAIAAFNLGAVGANPTVVPPAYREADFPAAPATQAGPAANAPVCQHGAMTYREAKPGSGKTWKAHFCPAPQGSNQCKPIFL